MKTFCLVGYYCAGCVKIEPEGDDQDGEQPAAGLQADTERGQPARSQAGGRQVELQIYHFAKVTGFEAECW